MQKSGIGVLLIVIGYTVGFFSYSITTSLEQQSDTTPIYASKKVKEVHSYLERYYYGFHSRTEQEREDAFLLSLTESLGDRHTNYFNPEGANEFVESLSGDFEGIGAVINDHKKGIQIMKVLSGSPAEESGLLQGDIILKIDETVTTGMAADDAVKIIRGPKGTTVVLTVLSGDIEKAVSIKRDRVVIPSVQSQMLTGSNIGYIEVAFFGQNTTLEFRSELEKVLQNNVSGIILDMRNNGGGYMDSSVDMASSFLEPGLLVVTTRGIRQSENMDYKTKKTKTNNIDIPIVVLINEMSASATEILAGALQDYDRALIVGVTSYGKGSVQEPFILSDGSMLKITIAKWYTPKNREIDERGITPDVEVSLSEEDYKNLYDRQLESAKILLEYIKNNRKTIVEIKQNQENIDSILTDAGIYF